MGGLKRNIISYHTSIENIRPSQLYEKEGGNVMGYYNNLTWLKLIHIRGSDECFNKYKLYYNIIHQHLQ